MRGLSLSSASRSRASGSGAQRGTTRAQQQHNISIWQWWCSCVILRAQPGRRGTLKVTSRRTVPPFPFLLPPNSNVSFVVPRCA
jgi:hypothetical protein